MKTQLLKPLVIFLTLFATVATVTGVRRNMDDHYFKGKDQALEMAILADDRSAISEAIAHGANVNARGVQQITPLMLAVDGLKKSGVSELLARGADPNIKAEDKNTAVRLWKTISDPRTFSSQL
jgi:hypothetical protein